MEQKETVTCSFIVDRILYNDYKSIVVKNGGNVRGNIIAYMKAVIDAGTTDIIAEKSDGKGEED